MKKTQFKRNIELLESRLILVPNSPGSTYSFPSSLMETSVKNSAKLSSTPCCSHVPAFSKKPGLPAVCLWASCFTFLCLYLLTCKMKIIVVPWDCSLEQCLAHCKLPCIYYYCFIISKIGTYYYCAIYN